MSGPVVGKIEPLTADTRQDRELRGLRDAVRALTDRVAQLEARLAGAADPGVDHPRRPRAR